ncbi:MAG: pyruvate dehydrogenase (acetyl-transferring) E1 component subunit alpha [Myxococcaceae bacterium]|nr:pyruvate dehydrogenase (acetyl-transferring) E1 component subunit alpha [Myxococcaceae bacterium]MCA3011666.1 pyruvate dehydrogenase (acetyl-transferring) E1 component subunit alpha [Myxococcaceae bacterium]
MTPEVAHACFTQLTRIRRFEEACAQCYAEGRIRGFLHLSIGEEAIAVGAMRALTPADAVVATYREHGHALARGLSMRSVMAEMFGKKAGCARGRGGSMHLFDAATRFYGGNAIVAGHLPLAVGLALADHRLARDVVTACFFGEGAVAEGEFHEALNLAALWRLPVLFLCENNRYAMGTALERSEAETDLTKKAASYRVPAQQVDGMNVEAVADAVAEAAGHARAGRGPWFLELLTYRFRAHSMFDAELYRSKEEVKAWTARCPVATFRERAKAAGALTDDDVAKVEAAVRAEVADAIAFADAAEVEPVAELTWAVTRREVAP